MSVQPGICRTVRRITGLERDICGGVAGDGRANLDGLLIGDDLGTVLHLVAGQIGNFGIGASAEAARHFDQSRRQSYPCSWDIRRGEAPHHRS